MNMMSVKGNEVKMKYYQRESGTIVMIDENMKIFYLDNEKKWVNDQQLIDMFLEDLDYKEISEEEVRKYISNS